MQLPHFNPQTSTEGKALYLISSLSFLLSMILGLLAALHVGLNSEHLPWIAHLKMTFLRPAHTMLAIAAMLSGGMAISESLIQSLNPQGKSGLSRWMVGLYITFITTALITLALGVTSGREYFSWHPIVSVFLIAAIALQLLVLLPSFQTFSQRSPEGTWLLFLGWTLTLAGLVESHTYLLAPVFGNGIRDLTSQWHGIDTVIAGINVLLYSGMIFFLQQKPKQLRKVWLFAIAGFGLLGTFGHHHYISPQPHYLKVFAFLASMVAILSFTRHIRGYLQESALQKEIQHPILPLVLSAEYWTIVAVGSGVLFAIPQINFFVHGTYLIIIHAMGSMIGINLLIIVAAGLLFLNYNPQQSRFSIKWGVRMVNWGLSILWIGLSVPSLLKGVLRTQESYQEYFPIVEPWLIILPIAGIVLGSGIFVLLSEVIWLAIDSRSSRQQICTKKPRVANARL